MGLVVFIFNFYTWSMEGWKRDWNHILAIILGSLFYGIGLFVAGITVRI